MQAIDGKMGKHDQVEAGRKPASMGTFPWLSEFQAKCNSSFMRQDPSSLIKLMRFFYRNISSHVDDCYKTSSRAAELKELIKEALLLFMYFHRFGQSQDQNRAVYLEQMSDLLAVYIDLELVASKRDAEPQHGKISARLVSYLHTYLDYSAEHLLDTIIKVQFVNETYCQILDAVISKLFKIVQAHPETEVMYVRYLLVYRLWERLHVDPAAKSRISADAISSLRSPPANLPEALLERVLPKPPAGPTTTGFYLREQFDLGRACSQFLQYCRECREEEAASPVVEVAENAEKDAGLETTITPATERVIQKNFINKKPSKQLDDIILIDLTDEDVTKIVKRKKHRRLDWLQDAKRSIDLKIKESALKKDKDVITSFTANQQAEDKSQISNDKARDILSLEIESIHKFMDINSQQAELGNIEYLQTNVLKVIPYSSLQRRMKDNENSAAVNSSQTKITDYVNNSEQIQAYSSWYQESDINGLILPACILAHPRQAKETELKVNPYSSLQLKIKDNEDSEFVDNVVGTYTNDTLGKVTLEVKVSSTEFVSRTDNKSEQQQGTQSSGVNRYILYEMMQNNSENYGSTNAILNEKISPTVQEQKNSKDVKQLVSKSLLGGKQPPQPQQQYLPFIEDVELGQPLKNDTVVAVVYRIILIIVMVGMELKCTNAHLGKRTVRLK